MCGVVLIACMARHNESWWAKRVGELRQTGDAAGLAQKHGVREKTLVWWKTELARRAQRRAQPRMLPVVMTPVAPEPKGANASNDLEVFVEMRGRRITVRGALSAEQLAAIVTAAGGSC
jgi:hypothetical protein